MNHPAPQSPTEPPLPQSPIIDRTAPVTMNRRLSAMLPVLMSGGTNEESGPKVKNVDSDDQGGNCGNAGDVPKIVLAPKVDSAVAKSAVAAAKAPQQEIKAEYVGQYVGPISPRLNDVLFGKGYKKHPGNVVLREVMDAQEKEYEGATKRRKMELTCVIVQSLIWSGARFCVREDGQWYEVKYIQAHRKVSKALRNRRRSK